MKSIIYNEFLMEFRNLTNILIFIIISFAISFIQKTPEVFLFLSFFQIIGIYINKRLIDNNKIFEKLIPLKAESILLAKYIYLLIKIFISSVLYLLLFLIIYYKINFIFLKNLFIFISLSFNFGVIIIFRKLLIINENNKVNFYITQFILLVITIILYLVNIFFITHLKNNIIYLINILFYLCFLIISFKLFANLINKF